MIIVNKRVMVICMALVFLFSTVAFAAVQTITVRPTLSFTGTTANCGVTISAPGKYIDATLELWNGNTKVQSWNKTGTGYVSIAKTKAVTSGNTYTLIVTGTIGSDDIDGIPVTKTCP